MIKFLYISAILAVLPVGAMNAQIPSTSIIELIANPKSFDGQKVRIQGVVNFEFESNAIYLSKEHWQHSVTSCGIWIDVTPKMAEQKKWANGKYFVIEGTFHADEKGHMGLWRGSISEITMLLLHEIIKPSEIPKADSIKGESNSHSGQSS